MVRVKKKPSQVISIEDVAKRAGVSITTVSRVINKLPTVKEKNRIKVMNAIRELNFHPSVLAQRLATGRSNVVGLVIPRYEGMFYSFYLLELIRGIGTLCEVLKLDLLLHLTESHAQLEMSGAGGMIFADIIGNRKQLDVIREKGIPCVVINHYLPDIPVSCIAIDNAGGAEQAVDYLVSLGHRGIAHISGDIVTQAAEERLKGYQWALEKHHIPIKEEYIFKTDYSRGQARVAAEKLMGMLGEITAVFVASDAMALEVMAVAREMGKRIPQDLSIVGFDDNPSGLYGPVALTTVRQPLIQMAEEGIKVLHETMGSKERLSPEKIRLPAELVIRESCRPL
jgi:DNA-binding LacI/PurR family transcriptional regulator